MKWGKNKILMAWSMLFFWQLIETCPRVLITEQFAYPPLLCLTKAFFFFPFIFISWRLITLHIVVVFVIHWHGSAMDLHVFRILIPPPISLSTWSLWVFPMHQAWALVSCMQPGLVICFTLDNIHVLMQSILLKMWKSLTYVE